MTDLPDFQSTFSDARRRLDAGQAEAARDLLAQLLAQSPDRADVRFHMARADMALGNLDAAAEGFELALKAAPKEPSIWMELALLAHLSGDQKGFGRRLRDAGLPKALVAMAMAASTGQGARALGHGAASRADIAKMVKAAKARDVRMVERIAQAALAKGPGAVVFLHLGQARLASAGKAAEAFRAGLKQEPYAEDLRLGLVRALLREGQMKPAYGEGLRLVEHAPAWPDAWVAFARVCLGVGLTEKGFAAAQTALSLAPRSVAARTLAAEAALAMGDGPTALDLARQLPKDAPRRAIIMGHAADAARDAAAALGHFTQAINAAPKDAEPLIARAQVLQSLNRGDEAAADLRAALALSPTNGQAARALAYGQKLEAGSSDVQAMEAALTSAGPEDRRLIQYALGRVYEKSDAVRSFAYLSDANAATAKAFPFEADADMAEFARISGPLWDAVQKLPLSQSKADPIFVTGLPRSGTTLVETILAAHPGVHMGGELGVLNPVFAGHEGDILSGTAADDVLTVLADAFDDRARRKSAAPADIRFTDKSIHTFVRLGIVLRALPLARVIVVRRDPRDTGLSIWRNHFRDGTHRYAATWDGIAEHVALFEKAIAFWKGVLPEGAFHEIRYEDLLADPEGQSRALLSAASLDWDPAVLSFHEGKSRIDTLSFAQVRQPIYTTSKGGWRQHEDHIAPLIRALSERGLLPDD